MEFARLFTISAFEGLRLLRVMMAEMPHLEVAACRPALVARSPQASAYDLDASEFLHPMVAPEADHDSVLFYRECVVAVMFEEMPAWAKLMTLGRGRFIKSLRKPEYRDIISVFREARLLDEPPSDADILWWDMLQQRVRQDFSEEANARSRESEKLTLAYEREQLSNLGIGMEPVWTAIEDNTAGYDITSYRYHGPTVRNLLIEVKSTIASPLRFVVSHGEWDKADAVGEAYLFYIWDMTKNPPALHIRTVDDVRPHIPLDGAKGRWKDCFIPVT